MLIAIFTILILGGSSTAMLAYIADTQDSVKIIMTKDDRQKEALSTLKAMKKRTDARNKEVNHHIQRIAGIVFENDYAVLGISPLPRGQSDPLDVPFPKRGKQ